jgi:hypothetical protein
LLRSCVLGSSIFWISRLHKHICLFSSKWRKFIQLRHTFLLKWYCNVWTEFHEKCYKPLSIVFLIYFTVYLCCTEILHRELACKFHNSVTNGQCYLEENNMYFLFHVTFQICYDPPCSSVCITINGKLCQLFWPTTRDPQCKNAVQRARNGLVVHMMLLIGFSDTSLFVSCICATRTDN